MSDRALVQQLAGFSLTTAEILYRMPDHRSLLQSFVWQDYDVAPRFPKLLKFLDYWATHLDGPVHRVRVSHKSLISPCEFTFRDGQFVAH